MAADCLGMDGPSAFQFSRAPGMGRKGEKMARVQSSGEEIANTVTHVVGSHLGAAMLALLVWQGAQSGVDVA